MPSPMRKMTFLACVAGVAGGVGGVPEADFEVWHAVAASKTTMENNVMQVLTDSSKFFARQGPDSSFEFECKKDGCEFTWRRFGFIS